MKYGEKMLIATNLSWLKQKGCSRFVELNINTATTNIVRK